jgi:hypothetical protein
VYGSSVGVSRAARLRSLQLAVVRQQQLMLRTANKEQLQRDLQQQQKAQEYEDLLAKHLQQRKDSEQFFRRPQGYVTPVDQIEPTQMRKDRSDELDQEAERRAAGKLKLARALQGEGLRAEAVEYCEDILKRYPRTQAAAEAQLLMQASTSARSARP